MHTMGLFTIELYVLEFDVSTADATPATTAVDSKPREVNIFTADPQALRVDGLLVRWYRNAKDAMDAVPCKYFSS